MLQTKTTCPRAWAHSRRPLLGILALAGLAAAAACGSGEEATGPGGPGGGARGGPPGGFGGAPRPETAVPVEVVEILPGSIAAFIETNGTLEAEREVDIVARTGGPIVGLNTEEGRQVKAGELLAQIDELEARAQVEIARVTLQDAETAYDRAKASLENEIVSREVYDQAFSAFESAKAQLEGNEIQLGYTQIKAPFDGLIIQRAIKFGETVTAGQQLFRISDFDPLLCTIGVPERDLSRLSIGQPAILEVEAFPGERFDGRVLRISPVVDAATGTIRVTLAVDRQNRLSPGMFAAVRLVTDVRQNALIMPKRALSLESLADSVFVVEDGVAYRRNITLGYEEDDRVEVTGGLRANDRVIVVGQDGLTDATPVQILVGPGAEEPLVRTAGGGAPGGGSEMTEERRAQMRERMRARGMTDEQIDQRLAAMAAGGGPPGGPGRRSAGGPPGAGPGAERGDDAGAAAPATPSAPATPTSPAVAADAAPSDATSSPPPAAPSPAGGPGSAANPGEDAGRRRGPPGGGPEGRSFESLAPEAQEAIRARLRAMGMTEEQIEERVQQGWGPGPATTPGGEMTPEAIEALRERLRSRGMTEEQIEEIVARRRGSPR